MNRCLTPLAAGFGCAVRLRGQAYRRGWLKPKRLGRPVISVGNLTVGGTGKTPLVILITELLTAKGLRPAILTRGYGRNGAHMMAIEPGAARHPDPRQAGDEPALMARKAPEAPVLISSDRFRAGREAEERFGADVHILDDGFQHWALARDLDLVLMDSTQSLLGDALLPAGCLRERVSALGRADALVLTRADLADVVPMEQLARRMNPQAPVYHSRLKLTGLAEIATGRLHPPSMLQGQPLFAFCGLGNPEAFFASLRSWNFTLVGKKVFRDHHIYPDREVVDLGRRARESKAEACITTEKDAMNLSQATPEKCQVPIFCCVVEAEVQEADEFEDLLLQTAAGGRRKTA